MCREDGGVSGVRLHHKYASLALGLQMNRCARFLFLVFNILIVGFVDEDSDFEQYGRNLGVLILVVAFQLLRLISFGALTIFESSVRHSVCNPYLMILMSRRSVHVGRLQKGVVLSHLPLQQRRRGV